jgi:50S ribosomal protein L16 3-hydroxylase
VDALIAAVRRGIEVWPPGQGKGITVAPEVAKRFYDLGFTLVFDNVDTNVASLRNILDRVKDDLGLSAADASCWAFAARQDSALHTHFDSSHTFNVQLRGKKRWWVAPKEEFAVPPEAGRARAAREALPLPRRTFVAGPGSVVWLPKGWWHATQIIEGEESFSITFNAFAKTRARIVSEALERILLREPAWAQPALGLSGHRSRSEGAEMTALLQRLPARAASVSLEALREAEMPPYAGSSWRFQPRAKGLHTRLRRRGATRFTLELLRSGRVARRLNVDNSSVAQIAEWALTREGGFRGSEVLAIARGLSPNEVTAVLRFFVESKLLRRARGVSEPIG